jgi:hypothetical protein
MRHHIRVATDARRRHQTVHIPGVSDSVDLIGASGDKLVIVGQMGCSGGVERVILYPKS